MNPDFRMHAERTSDTNSIRWVLDRSWGRMTPYLSILNLYNRKNVLFYFFEYDKDPPVRTGISMFPFLPSLGLEVSF